MSTNLEAARAFIKWVSATPKHTNCNFCKSVFKMYSTQKGSFEVLFSMKNHFLIALLFALWSNGYSQAYKPMIPSLDLGEVKTAWHPDTGKQRILSRLEDKKLSEKHERISTEAGAISYGNLLLGNAYKSWPEYEKLLETTAKEMIAAIGDTMPVSVQITRDVSVNANATAGGYVYFNVGLLAEMKNYEELALVLAHELGHNLSNHWIKRIEKKERLEKQIESAADKGVLIMLMTLNSARYSYMEHSRANEREADTYARHMLNKTGFSAYKAAQVYTLFRMIELNHRVKSGNRPSKTPYGSTHPDTWKRKELMELQSEFEESDKGPANFTAMRNKARYEKLSLLIGKAEYRTAIESAWRYLIETPENDTLEQFMFDATRKLMKFIPLEQQEDLVLFSGYIQGKKLEKALKKNKGLKNNELNSYLKALMMTNTTEDNWPIPYSVSFKELYNLLKARVEEQNSMEGNFLISLEKNTVTPELLEDYIKNEGVYSSYASLLQKRNELVLDSGLFVPYHVNTKKGQKYGFSYYSQLKSFNWYQGEKALKKLGYKTALKLRYSSEDMNARDRFIIPKLESWTDLISKTQKIDVDFALFDPIVGEYLLNNHIGEFITFNIYQPRLFIKTELALIDIKSNTPSLRMACKRAKKEPSDLGMVYDQIPRLHKKIQH